MSPVVQMRSAAPNQQADAHAYTRTAVAQVDIRTLYGNLLQLAETQERRDEFLSQLLQTALSVTNGLGGAYFVHNPHRGLMLGPRLFSPALLASGDNPQPMLIEHAKSCAQSGQTMVIAHATQKTAILVPVSISPTANEVLSIIVDAPKAMANPFIVALQLIAGYVNLKDKSTLIDLSAWEAQTSAELIELMNQMHTEDDQRALGFTLVNELRRLMGAQYVVLGERKGMTGGYAVSAISGLTEHDERTEISRAMEAVFAETATQQTTLVYPELTQPGPGINQFDHHPFAVRCAKVLADELNCTSVASTALTDSNHDVHSVVAVVWKDKTDLFRHRNRLMAYAPALGECLQRLTRTRTPYALNKAPKAGLGKWIFVGAIALVVGAMFIPVQHRIKAPIVMEPVVNRYISAQFDGMIESVLVEPGDVVNTGDLLARLDGRELRFQHEALKAELSHIQKQRDIASADGDTSAVQLADAEAQRVTNKLELVTLSQEQLDIFSPMAGSVVSGDLSRLTGSPVARGQTLFEVAPLDRFVAELAVPAEDVSYIQQGATTQIELQAFPGDRIDATLATIQPRSEVRDSKNVFVAEVQVNNTSGHLRPGMRGTGRIDGDVRALGWVLFHKPLERMRLWLGLSTDDASE